MQPQGQSFLRRATWQTSILRPIFSYFAAAIFLSLHALIWAGIMIGKKLRPFLLLVVYFACSCIGYCQKMTDAELDRLEKAQVMLDEKNYRLALPVFEQLLKKHPNETR